MIQFLRGIILQTIMHMLHCTYTQGIIVGVISWLQIVSVGILGMLSGAEWLLVDLRDT